MDSNADFHSFVESLEGTEVGRILSIALFSLTVYEYIITLDEEIKYFWSGYWTLSRVLFFVNRYLSPLIMIIAIICYSVPDPSPDFCRPAVQATQILNVLAVGVIQGILAARIWFLFRGKRTIQYGIILGFAGSLVSSLVLLSVSLKHVRAIDIDEIRHLLGNKYRNEGCKVERPRDIWRIFLPSLVLHSALYLLTAFRALRNRQLLKNAPVMKRLLRDGGFFYFVVFGSVTVTTVGAFLTNYPKLNIPSIYSHFLLAVTSIAVSRVMFSIHSLADKLGSDSAWLLTNAQLQRLGWRRGTHEGELIVERHPVYSDIETEAMDMDESRKGSFHSLLRETKVGVYDQTTW